jgi:hypothetical protein
MAACDEPRWCGENPGTPTPRPRYPRPGTASRSSYIGRFVRPLGVDARCRALQGRDGPAASPATHRRVGGVAGPRRWGAPSASSAARLESRNREPHATPVAEARRHHIWRRGHTTLQMLRCWLGRKDSNLRSPDPESGALPLGHTPARYAQIERRSGPNVTTEAVRGSSRSLSDGRLRLRAAYRGERPRPSGGGAGTGTGRQPDPAEGASEPAARANQIMSPATSRAMETTAARICSGAELGRSVRAVMARS